MDARPLRHNTEYRCLLTAFGISGIGDWMFGIAFAAWVYDRTGSGAWVSLAIAARYLPGVASALLGTIADRRERRGLMLRLDVTRALLLAALAVTFATGAPLVLGIALAAAESIATSIYRAAVVALVPDVVRTEDLTRANSREAVVNQVAVFAGPALGALLMRVAGPGAVFAFDAFTFAAAALLVSRVRPRPRRSSVETRASGLAVLGAGLRALRRDAMLLRLLGLLAAMVVLYGGQQVLYLQVAGRFGDAAAGASLLVAASGLGALAASAAASRAAARADALVLMRLAGLATSIPFLCLAFAPSLPVAAAIVLADGAGTLLLEVVGISELQRRCDPAVLGRVWGLVDTVLIAGTVLGAALAGILSVAVGAAATLTLVGAGVTLAVVALTRRTTPVERVELEPVAAELALVQGV